jgi:hypothetical protein
MSKPVGSHLPRNGRYEIFSHGGVTNCFDDTDIKAFPTPKGMFEWIRSQDPKLWRPMDSDPDCNVALYLKPELYIFWKLKWS